MDRSSPNTAIKSGTEHGRPVVQLCWTDRDVASTALAANRGVRFARLPGCVVRVVAAFGAVRVAGAWVVRLDGA